MNSEWTSSLLSEEQKCPFSKMRRSDSRGTELNQTSAFLSACPVSMSHHRWGERGGGEEESPSSMQEDSVYVHDQHSIVDSTTTPALALSATPVTHRPCLSMTDTCSPFSPVCSRTGSTWDALRSRSKTPGCCDRDPVSAAAHLHLLGESLSLIGQHLQETDKKVCMSGSLSLLLDSLLCALAPLICLTVQIPELRSCTQHTLASTLENISYVMPGL